MIPLLQGGGVLLKSQGGGDYLFLPEGPCSRGISHGINEVPDAEALCGWGLSS